MALKLDIKFDLKKVPKGARIAIAVTPAVIIAILFVMFVYMPKTKEIKKLNTVISAQENEIAKNKTIAAKLDILKVENDKLIKELKELQEKLPEEEGVSTLIQQIAEIAVRADIDILTWKPEIKKAHPSGIVEEIPFSLTLAGTYHNLGSFFSSLTRLNRIVNVSDIQLGDPKARKEEAALNISLKAITFSAVKEKGK
ncbi:MAG: type 4a pilus biogenesis protein PilO [Thermodesulfovibrionales bacterium]|nr:type 4a pilus biogenesis protein PilO [Thermodesulfovibrionales bacterium]